MLVLTHANGACMQLFINEIASRYPQENVVMVVDGAGWRKADFKMPDSLRVQFLSPYLPELNPQGISGMSCGRSG